MIGVRLGDACRDRADPDFGNELDADPGVRVDVLQVVDELLQVFDGVDVVVRRRRDQADSRCRVPDFGDPRVDLVAGELATLTGFGALRHLDLDVSGVDEVLCGDPESAGCDLLDRGTHRVAVLERHVAARFFAALTGVRLGAEAVHGDGEIRVRLPRDRAERHGPGGESFHDLGGWFNLVKRDGLDECVELEQAAQVLELAGLIVDQPGVLLEEGVVAGTYGVLQGGDGFRGPYMFLAADAERVVATDVEVGCLVRLPSEGRSVTADRLFGDRCEPNPLDHRRRAGEVVVDEFGVEAHGVEDLRAAVRLECRDTHLRHHLQDAHLDGVDVGGHRVLGCRIARQFVDKRTNAVEGEVRVDGFGPVSTEEAEIVDLAGLTGLDDEADLGAQPFPDEMVVDGGSGEERRNRDAVCFEAPVGENDDVPPVTDRLCGPFAQPIERRADALDTLIGRITDAEFPGSECMVDVVLDASDAFEAHVGEDRVVDLEPLLRSAHVEVEEVRPWSDERHQRHHRLLPDRIDRRVGDLGKPFLEVVGEHLRSIREHRGWCIAAHRTNRILALGGHRLQEELDVLLGVAERLLRAAQRLCVGRHGCNLGWEIVEPDLGFAKPLLVRLGTGQRFFELLIADDPTLFEVNKQHLARLKPPLLDDLLFRDVEHAHLRRKHDEVIVGHEIAAGAEPVSVEGRADLATVGERHGGRTVPRLHQGRVVFIEGLAASVHQRVVGPGLGDEQRHGMPKRVAAGEEEFQGVVERGRVGGSVTDEGPELREVIAEDVGRHVLSAGHHPVDIPLDRVDLAVVAEIAERVGETPGGGGVRGEPLVDERKG